MMPIPSISRKHALAGGAGLLGVLALVAGEPNRRTGATVDVDRLAAIVQAEQDHVTALELARWIRERKPGLRVIDVRGADDFAAFHLPTAENLSLTQLTRARFRPDETVVLYSEGGTHAAQGWFFLRARGLDRVFFLREGLYEWATQIVEPRLPDDASAETKARWPEQAALSRYFGGSPRVGGTAQMVDDPTAALPRASADEAGGELPRPASGESGESTAAVARIRARGC
jgi:rhodanese-related sulfurtransferase